MKSRSKKQRIAAILLFPVLSVTFLVGYVMTITNEWSRLKKKAKKQPIHSQAIKRVYNFEMEVAVTPEQEARIQKSKQ